MVKRANKRMILFVADEMAIARERNDDLNQVSGGSFVSSPWTKSFQTVYNICISISSLHISRHGV